MQTASNVKHKFVDGTQNIKGKLKKVSSMGPKSRMPFSSSAAAIASKTSYDDEDLDDDYDYDEPMQS